MRYFIVCGLLMLASASVQAKTNGFVEPLLQAEHGQKAILVVDGGLSWPLPAANEQFGISAYFWVQKDWAEVYAGPTWQPLNWLQIGLGIGMDQYMGGLRVRYATALNLAYGLFVMTNSVEFCNDALSGADRSCIWYDFTPKVTACTAKADDKTIVVIAAGVKLRRFVGVGPYLEFQFPTGYTTIWITYIPYDPEGLNSNGEFVRRVNPRRFLTGVMFGF